MTAHALRPGPPAAARSQVAWITSRDPVPYADAIAAMEARVSAIIDGHAGACVWLLEHPCVYTGGTSAKPSDLVDPARFPVITAGRGGGYTYHGPGQRVAYVMLDLTGRGRDVRAFVRSLEDWLIATLARFGIEGERRRGAVGIFVRGAKIASIGVRVRRWVTFHGVSLNVDPELGHYSGIVPCGLKDTPVTSLAALGVDAGMDDVDRALRDTFPF